MSSKVYESPAAALHDVREGASIAVGGFGLVGNPEALIVAALQLDGLTSLAVVAAVGLLPGDYSASEGTLTGSPRTHV